jgi:hypothetical protein
MVDARERVETRRVLREIYMIRIIPRGGFSCG